MLSLLQLSYLSHEIMLQHIKGGHGGGQRLLPNSKTFGHVFLDHSHSSDSLVFCIINLCENFAPVTKLIFAAQISHQSFLNFWKCLEDT